MWVAGYRPSGNAGTVVRKGSELRARDRLRGQLHSTHQSPCALSQWLVRALLRFSHTNDPIVIGLFTAPNGRFVRVMPMPLRVGIFRRLLGRQVTTQSQRLSR